MFRAYSCFQDHFKNQIKLRNIDTDSFYLHVNCEDFYKELIDLLSRRYWINFSDIPASHQSGLGTYINLNAGVLGKCKDETKGNHIVEFVRLRFKMFSYSICEAQSSCSKPLPPIITTKKLPKVFLVLPNE